MSVPSKYMLVLHPQGGWGWRSRGGMDGMEGQLRYSHDQLKGIKVVKNGAKTGNHFLVLIVQKRNLSLMRVMVREKAVSCL